MSTAIQRFYKRYGFAIYLTITSFGIIAILIVKLIPSLKNSLAEQITLGIATNIISTAIIFFLVEQFFQFSILKQERSQLQHLINKLGNLTSIIEGGNISVKTYPSYPTELVRNKIKSATSRIRIAGTWPKSTEPLPNTLQVALSNNVKVQILYLDSTSATMTSRMLSMLPNDTQKERAKRVQVAFNSLSNFVKRMSNRENLEIKLSPISLSFRLIGCDSWLLVGFYWFGKTSAEGLHFEFEEVKHQTVYKELIEYFDEVFSDPNNNLFTI